MRRATLRIRSMPPTDVPPYFCTIRAMNLCSDPASQPAEGEGRVGPAEAERIGQRGANRHGPRRVGNEIEIAARILEEQVRGGRCHLIAQGEYRKDGLD